MIALSATSVAGRDWQVDGTGALSLAEVLDRAEPGDRVLVTGGIHRGPLKIDRRLSIEGSGWPVIEGPGSGTVISVRAPGTTISGFVIRGSGKSLDEENSGLTLDESPDSRISGNRFEDVLFGIYLRESSRSEIVDNVVTSKRLKLPRRGDAVRVWYSDDVLIENNRVSGSRDVVLVLGTPLRAPEQRLRGPLWAALHVLR